MMAGRFNREALPDVLSYFDAEGLKLSKRGKWRTTSCTFHGGSDSMRINLATGAWVCMACEAKGGDVLAYHMLAHGLEFIDAAKALGAWDAQGEEQAPTQRTGLTSRQALAALAIESNIVAVAAGNVARGVALTDGDRSRVMQAANRIARIQEAYA